LQPVASVILTARDERPAWLAQALDSALRQTAPVEIVLVDDGSLTEFDVSGPCVRFVRHEQPCGISAALNSGIREARTPYICWLPSDDVFYADKVERQLAAMEATDAKASFHMYHAFHVQPDCPHAVSAQWDWTSQLKQRRQLGVGCAINGLTTMVKREVFDHVGMFDESLKYSQDWEMWARIAHTYEWLPMPDVLAARRQSGENLTAKIEGDAELRRVRDAEDAEVRRRWGL
jgi:glycosyltransferase involved in cell wall biosynthesis